MKPTARGAVIRAIRSWLLLAGSMAMLCLPSLADSNPDAPVAVADRFLAGIESRDLAERERLLANILWQRSSIDHPPLDDAVSVRERIFATDVDRVVGYERLVMVAIPLQSGAHFTRTYRLVAYADRISGAWKIWSFEEGADIDSVVAFWGQEARRTTLPGRLGVAVRYAQCLGSSGQLQGAAAVYQSVMEAMSSDPNADTAALHAAHALQSLTRIMGTGAASSPRPDR